LVVSPIIYRVLYIPGGAGFLPSTVCTAMSSPFHRMILPSYDQEIIDFAVFNSISYKLTHDYPKVHSYNFWDFERNMKLGFFPKYLFLFYYIQNDDLSSSGCEMLFLSLSYSLCKFVI